VTFYPADYPVDWKDIVRQINDQAGNKCKFCGVANGAVGARDRDGSWHDEHEMDGMSAVTGDHFFEGEFPRIIMIVLTTAHLCHDKMCRDPGHIFALCQRCHLSHDRRHHLEVQARNRRRRIIERGQLPLTGVTP
jgi:hypothetical protein